MTVIQKPSIQIFTTKVFLRQRFLKRLCAGLSILMISFSALGCTQINGAEQNAATPIATAQPDLAISGNSTPNTDSPNTDSPNTANANTASPSADPELSTAIFAGGCFWCMEQPFDQLPGVVSTTSGYTGGTVENPTYAEVSGGSTGHVEAMEVRYDPQQVSYEKLLTTFWHNIDPLDNRGQFCDQGSQYRSAIFYDTAEQQALAEASKNEIAEQLDQPIATDILPAARFYDAEDYHQDYYQTHAVRYKVYRFGCGRDQRLSDLWGAEAPSH